MSKFKLTKQFSLSFLGDEWKNSYIVFNALTTSDMKKYFPKFTGISEDNPEDVTMALDAMIEMLQNRFIEGSGVGKDGKQVDIKKEDLEELPVEVLNEAVSFLSLNTQTISPKQ